MSPTPPDPDRADNPDAAFARDLTAVHARSLEALRRRNRLRTLQPRKGIDFTSNDYLGLASSELLQDAAKAALDRGVSVGSGGSRLLRGNSREHEALEAEAAQFFSTEATLFFSCGFTANTALFATLPQRGDLIVYDQLSHASTHEGIALTRADAVPVRHNDVDAFEDAIKTFRSGGGTGRIWIAVESLYSMDGDLAPLAELQTLADRHDAFLIVDEAHATGVLGKHGAGCTAALPHRANVISLHTCGKALGVEGALVAAPQVLIDLLINRARAFIYSTAPSPLVAAIVRAALVIVRFDDDRRQALAERIEVAGETLSEHLGVTITGTHIQPIVIGKDAHALAVADHARQHGFDIRAIRPPTVPEGTARLRLALTLNVTSAETVAMAEAVACAMADVAA